MNNDFEKNNDNIDQASGEGTYDIKNDKDIEESSRESAPLAQSEEAHYEKQGEDDAIQEKADASQGQDVGEEGNVTQQSFFGNSTDEQPQRFSASFAPPYNTYNQHSQYSGQTVREREHVRSQKDKRRVGLGTLAVI